MQTSEVNIFSKLEKQRPNRLCECSRMLPLMVKDEKLYRYPFCRKCLDPEVVASEGYTEPEYHQDTPMIFRATDENRLHPKMKEALSWRPTLEKSGMLLHGTTGIGKSRAAWLWTNRIWLQGIKRDLNLNFMFLSMMDFESMIQSSFSENKRKEILNEICDAPLLVLDDLGKERLTSRMSTDLFGIIDHRSLSAKTTIITTNFNGQGLIDRFPPQDKETGIALVRRLRDYYSAYGMSTESPQ